MARPSTIGPDAPSAWKARASVSASIEGAKAQASVARPNKPSPVSSIGFRPSRSESGPQKICPAAKPNRKEDSVACAPATSVCITRAISGREGR